MSVRVIFPALASLVSTGAWAQSLDCTGRDPDVCAAVNGLVPMVNAAAGSTVLTQLSSRNDFRPTGMYNRLLQVRAAAVAGGCEVDGYSGGVYDAGPAEAWAGGLDLLDASAAYDVDGVIVLSPAEWFGVADDGFETIDIGDKTGVHNGSGQVAANVGPGGFMVGNWFRRVGDHGLFYTLTGSCPGLTDAGDVFETYYVGDLPDFLIETFVSETKVNSPRITIPSNTPSSFTCTNVTVDGGLAVASGVAATVSLSHTFIGDLVVTLTSPDGTTITLMDRPQNGNPLVFDSSNLVATGLLRFVDGGGVNAEALGASQNDATPVCAANTTCNVNPHQPLSALVGEDPTGTWSLCVGDRAANPPAGTLGNFTLQMNVTN